MTSASFVVGDRATAQNLTITELNYHPAAPDAAESLAGFTDDDFEFIELTNTSSVTITLAGCRFTAGVMFEFPPTTTLAPGERLVVVRSAVAFQHHYPGVPVSAIAGEFHSPAGVEDDEKLANGGERIVLLDALGVPIADFSYDDSDPWPGDPDGDGATLVLRQASGSYGDGLNWRSSVAPGGTSAGSDTVPYAGGDPIEYALASPDGVMTFSSGGRMELAYRFNLAADDATYSIWRSLNLVTWTQADAEFKVDRRQNLGDGTVSTEYQTLDPVTDARIFYQLRVSMSP